MRIYFVSNHFLGTSQNAKIFPFMRMFGEANT